jgi:hypothetical protein
MSGFLIMHVGRSLPVARFRTQLMKRIQAIAAGAYLELDGVWLIESDDTADEIRDRVRDCVPPDDALIVFGIGDQTAWTGLPEEQADWLVERL